MKNPFKRKPTTEAPEATTRFPESWVTLLSTLKDPYTGGLRNCIDHFDSEEGARRYLEAASPNYLAGFKGAYREIPGFLARVQVPEVAKSRLEGPSTQPAEPEPKKVWPEGGPKLAEPAQMDIPRFVVVTRAEGQEPGFGGGFSVLAGARRAAAYLTSQVPVSAAVYEQISFYPRAEG